MSAPMNRQLRSEYPSPGVCENGAMACNAPLYDFDGEVIVGYCDEWVFPHHKKPRKRTHKGPHKLTWWDQ